MWRHHRRLLWGYALLIVACGQPQTHVRGPAAGTGKILSMTELTWTDIDALPRDRTLFLLVVGMLEEHGPHLPVGADTFGVEYEARHVADRLAQALLPREPARTMVASSRRGGWKA